MHDWAVQGQSGRADYGIKSRGEGRIMPTYEYHCRDCDRTFTVYMSIKDHEAEEMRCAHCHGTQIEQVLTSFVAVTSKKS